MKKFLLTCLVLGMAGCATQANYAKLLDKLIGAPETAVLDAWGVPSATYDSGGARYLAYRRSSTYTDPGTPSTVQTQVIGDRTYTSVTPGRPAETITSSCETTFRIEEGRVRSYSFRGSDCRARPEE